MSLTFREPGKGRNWRLLVEELGLASLSALTLNAGATYEGIRKAITESAPDPTPDERAWTWLRVALAVALFDLLNDPDLRSALDSPEKKAAANGLAAEALTAAAGTPLDAAMLLNPAAAPFLAPTLDRLPGLVRAAAPDCTASDAALRARFGARLRAASARIQALDPDFYRPVRDAFTGPAAEGLRRDLAWTRHANWIRDQFHETPIFALDPEEKIPLAAVYHRLRCYWIEERVVDKRFPSFIRRIAHVDDLHSSLHAWLAQPAERDDLRVVAGGPGSGKSSFSRAFATEVIAAGAHRLLYVPLHRLRLSGLLEARLGEYLRSQWHATDPRGAAGFESSPLDWHREDELPWLLVFDGLDELSHDEEASRELARRFIRAVHDMLRDLNGSGPRVRALVLGRDWAVEEAMREVELTPEALVHVAPMAPLVRDGRPESALGADDMEDPKDLADEDTRPAFWAREAAARGEATAPEPEAVTAEELRDFSAEPLLLHLLILSDYIGPRWKEAARNRNRVYRALFGHILKRNRDKQHPATGKLDEADFFTLLECLGLAAWRGGGRSGSAEDFLLLRDLHPTGTQRKAFANLAAADLRNVAMQVHSRLESESQGFEFIHKSFGEYLAGRGLLAAGLRAAARMTEGDDPLTEEQVAEQWAKLIGKAEFSWDIVSFLQREAELLDLTQAAAAIPPLGDLLVWTLENGMPVQHLASHTSWRELETRQRCAEAALLAVLDALVTAQLATRVKLALPELQDRVEAGDFHLDDATAAVVRQILAEVPRLEFDWTDRRAPYRLLARHPDSIHVAHALSALPLTGALLTDGDLSDAGLDAADLSFANLDGANLHDASADFAIFRDASLNGAFLANASFLRASLEGASLRNARLAEASLLGANLTGAWLAGADLDRTVLSGAIFAEVDLRACRFRLNPARATDFRAAQLDPAALATIFGVRSGIGRTLLPPGMEPPAHWHEAADDAEDSAEARAAFDAAYRAWREAGEAAGR